MIQNVVTLDDLFQYIHNIIQMFVILSYGC